MEIERQSRWTGLHPGKICLGCWAGIHFHQLVLKYVKEEKMERRQRGHVLQKHPLHSDLSAYSSGYEQALSLGWDD